jgi:hypothetical protein
MWIALSAIVPQYYPCPEGFMAGIFLFPIEIYEVSNQNEIMPL